MDKNKLIALTVLGIFGLFIFNELSEGKILSLLNDSVYYIFLFILILVGAGLALYFGAIVLLGCILPVGAFVGAIYFIIEGQYFLALVWFFVITSPIGFMDASMKNVDQKNEISIISKYYGCSMSKAQEYHEKLTKREIKVLEEELKKGRRYK